MDVRKNYDLAICSLQGTHFRSKDINRLVESKTVEKDISYK